MIIRDGSSQDPDKMTKVHMTSSEIDLAIPVVIDQRDYFTNRYTTIGLPFKKSVN